MQFQFITLAALLLLVAVLTQAAPAGNSYEERGMNPMDMMSKFGGGGGGGGDSGSGDMKSKFTSMMGKFGGGGGSGSGGMPEMFKGMMNQGGKENTDGGKGKAKSSSKSSKGHSKDD